MTKLYDMSVTMKDGSKREFTIDEEGIEVFDKIRRGETIVDNATVQTYTNDGQSAEPIPDEVARVAFFNDVTIHMPEDAKVIDMRARFREQHGKL